MDKTPVSEFELRTDGRVDRALAGQLQYSRTTIQGWIREGRVRVDGEQINDKSHAVEAGDVARVEFPEQQFDPDRAHPEPGEVPVVHEDDHLIVINKPRDLVVHPAGGHPGGTLANRLLYHYPDLSEVGESHRAGMVHRLDRETTGIMLIARTQQAYDTLKKQFANRTVRKKYRTVLEGELEDERVRVRVPIGRHPDNYLLRKADPAGKQAETLVDVVARHDYRTAAWCRPKTGRTHQIRVHARYLGHPVLGDEKYGTMTSGRLMLHAESITVSHPGSGEDVTYEAPPPEEVSETWDRTVNPSESG